MIEFWSRPTTKYFILPLENETDPSFRLAVSASKLGSSVNEI